MVTGTLYAVGVGPGDPDLLTLKAVRLIQSGALIAYPVGGDSGESFAREIALPHFPEGADEFGFSIPMRVAREPAARAYDEATKNMASTLANGRDVVLLCEGDPLFYGSAMYLIDRLAGDFPCETVPGITSLTACAASLNAPLAARNERLKVLPAPLEADVLTREIEASEAVAIIKVGRHFEKVRAVLKSLDLAKRAMVVERATGHNQKITRVSDVPEGERPYFSTILVYKGSEDWRRCGD